MTVPASYTPTAIIANGATTVFAYGFLLLDEEDAKVSLDGVQVTTGFTINGVDDPTGGDVTFSVAPAMGVLVTIERAMVAERTTDYQNLGDLRSDTLNDDQDRQTMLIQQVIESNLRSIRVPVGSTVDPLLTGLEASKFLRVNVAGNGIEFVDGTGTAPGEFLQSGIGAVARPLQSKLGDHLDARDFGAVGNGVVDDTAALQYAINEAATTGRALYIGPGTFIVTALTGLSNIEIVGDGIGKTTIKRKASAVGNAAVIDFTSKTGFALRGMTFDGNKSAQTNASQACTLSACSEFVVESCAFINAKAVGGGFGGGLVLVDCTTVNVRAQVRNCKFAANDSEGVLARNCRGLDIVGNLAANNVGGGILLADYTFPPVNNKQTQITVSNNHCYSNGGSGIGVSGYYTGGTLPAPIYGPSASSSFITVSNNVCAGNFIYGIAWQGAYGAVTGNTCFLNTGYGFSAGILFNGLSASCTGNNCFSNEVYGIDAGGSYHSTVAGNSCFGNTVGINLGASVDTICSGNQITLTGGSAATGITMPGLDGDGATPYPTIGNGSVIQNNKIVLNGHAGSRGITIGRDYAMANVRGNTVAAASAANQAYVFEVERIAHEQNIDAYLLLVSGGNFIVVASAATLVIPDHAEIVFVSGTTGITNIRTASQNFWFQKVRDVRITAQGSGYVRATPPTVNFIGGGGAGAAGTVEIDNGGRIVGVTMTNNGSGYTSAPAITFTGGTGGAGAAGTALVGCANANGRTIQLFFQGALTVTDGGNLALAGNLVTTANGASLRLLGAYDGYYELGRSSGL